MAKKNAFLQQLQAKTQKDAKTMMDLTERFTRQAAMDAALLTLGYGKCMRDDPWGAKRLVAFGEEFIENFLFVMQGCQYSSDADAIRVQVDKLLKAKLPEDRYGDWSIRYRGWVEEPLEVEAQKRRGKWVREGMDVRNDGGTSELLKGVGR